MSAKSSYEIGNLYPYDEKHDGDWAVKAARGIIADLTDRRGIKFGFDNIELDIKVEIVQSLAEIVRLAANEAA